MFLIWVVIILVRLKSKFLLYLLLYRTPFEQLLFLSMALHYEDLEYFRHYLEQTITEHAMLKCTYQECLVHKGLNMTVNKVRDTVSQRLL